LSNSSFKSLFFSSTKAILFSSFIISLSNVDSLSLVEFYGDSSICNAICYTGCRFSIYDAISFLVDDISTTNLSISLDLDSIWKIKE